LLQRERLAEGEALADHPRRLFDHLQGRGRRRVMIGQWLVFPTGPQVLRFLEQDRLQQGNRPVA